MSASKTYDHQPETSKEAVSRETQLAANDNAGNILKQYTQPKLFVGASSDPYEQEADAVADTVMRMPASHFVQRKCSHCEEEEKQLQRKPLSVDIPAIQTKPDTVTYTLNASKGGGEQMDHGTRSFMESRFSTDFSRVKIHTNEDAIQMSRSLQAKAFTSGRDIYFNKGQYQPGTDDGKHLLAHELTHTIQQNGDTGHAIQRFPETATDDPIHGPMLDEYCAETGQDRATTSQHDPGFRAWLQSRTPVTIAPVIDPSCTNPQMVITTVQTALQWIDDVYDQLIHFEADVIFGSPRPDFARVQSALQQTFHTTDWAYVSVIASRFYHIGRMLREPGRVTIFCGGPGCRSSGSSFTAAYVGTPYEIHLCGGNPSIATFIHEMCHAVIPTVGIRNTVQPGGGLNDRAYSEERVFHHLTPEESLDNAEAYGILAEALFNRATGNIVPPQIDTVTGTCPNNTLALAAIARAEQATRWGFRMLDAWLRFIAGSANHLITDLPTDDQDFIRARLPAVQSVADMRDLSNSFSTLYASGYRNNSVNINCIGNASVCANNIVGVASGGQVTTTSVNITTQSATGDMDLCDSWFSLSENDRIRTMFALRLFNLGPGGKGNISNADGLTLADFCLAVQRQQMPPPTTTDATAHMFADQPTAPIP